MSTATNVSQIERKPELLGQTVVVIGGSAGIGLETARRASAEGAKLILTGRSSERLRSAASEFEVLSTSAFDATDTASLEQFFRDLPATIDHVMVTAGGPHYGRLFDMDIEQARLAFEPSGNFFEALSSQDTAVELSGQLKVLSVSLMKIANDLRWMGSGPLAGLGEISLPALQPGSSIMPGKVNPVVPESVAMIAAQVIGNDTTITVAGQSGNFQLNVMLPVIAYNLLQSLELLAIACRNLADHAVAGLTLNQERLQAALERNPILITALNPVIGYEKGAAIAKKAYAEGRPILEVAAEMTDLKIAELRRLLDPLALTTGGIKGPGSSG